MTGSGYTGGIGAERTHGLGIGFSINRPRTWIATDVNIKQIKAIWNDINVMQVQQGYLGMT